MHYHVGQNIPGYMADDVYVVRTKKDAIQAVRETAKRYRESEWDLPRSERRASSGNAEHGAIYFWRIGDTYDLGWRIWWDACPLPDCNTEEE